MRFEGNLKQPGLPQLRKWSGKNKILEVQEKVWEFYFLSRRIEIILPLTYTIDGWKKHFRSMYLS